MKNISKNIGQELIQESMGPQPRRRGISDELFPYILVASLNGMSSRAISRWLEEKQEVKLSAAMVAKVIREADTRMLRLYDVMREKELNFYRMMLSVVSTDVHGNPLADNLFDKNSFEVIAAQRNDRSVALIVDECSGLDKLIELYDFLMEEWFSLPERFREECKKIVNKRNKEMGE